MPDCVQQHYITYIFQHLFVSRVCPPQNRQDIIPVEFLQKNLFCFYGPEICINRIYAAQGADVAKQRIVERQDRIMFLLILTFQKKRFVMKRSE